MAVVENILNVIREKLQVLLSFDDDKNGTLKNYSSNCCSSLINFEKEEDRASAIDRLRELGNTVFKNKDFTKAAAIYTRVGIKGGCE